MKRTIPALAASFLGFIAVEGLVFHTGLYPSILSLNSSAGYLELQLYNEQHRTKQGPNQILAIGDSRMALMPKVSNELTPETGYTFASIAVGGTTPRAWYYMLRGADPDANRYSAVMITLETYDDAETWVDLAEWGTDLHYIIARLRLSDLFEYANSYHSTALKWEAFRGILLKGLVYKRDFADFLLDPVARIKSVDLAHRESVNWYNGFVPSEKTMLGVTVDWAAHKVTAPPDRTPAEIASYESILLQPQAPDTGRQSAYLHYWLGKIYEHYRGSHTSLVFVREAREPFPHPNLPPLNPHSSVRELAAHPEVMLVPEHFFDSLERPELFLDEHHLNGTGVRQFSHMLAREMREILGPPQ